MEACSQLVVRLRAGAAALICGMLCLASGCASVANKVMYPAPQPPTYKAQDVLTFNTADGVRLAGMHQQRPGRDITVVYSHGNGEDLGHLRNQLGQFEARGYNTFAYDYRGYGWSEGSPNEQGTYRDLEAALQYLKQRGIGSNQIILAGYSIGTGPSVELASRPGMKDLRGLVLFAPFTEPYDMFLAGRAVPGGPYKNINKIGKVKCPVLIIHGARDKIIPLSHGRKLQQAATRAGVDSRMVVVANGNHVNLWNNMNDPAIWRRLDEMAQGR